MSGFLSYDFEKDPNWRQYKSNLTIPPGQNVNTVIERVKRKWYKNNVDPTFEPSSVPIIEDVDDAPETTRTSNTRQPQMRQQHSSNSQTNPSTATVSVSLTNQLLLLVNFVGIIFGIIFFPLHIFQFGPKEICYSISVNAFTLKYVLLMVQVVSTTSRNSFPFCLVQSKVLGSEFLVEAKRVIVYYSITCPKTLANHFEAGSTNRV
eukprot:TRINITY_DN8189_c0_g1_i2.p1 TRINITY_DN8189_c0_g1~~TRINITY_DN8189_c0_g1_i2.p1  ORF type:complete len:206 (-),score=28.62 TRINITY_DN8189_c0_g1_i2:708-1325(-)